MRHCTTPIIFALATGLAAGSCAAPGGQVRTYDGPLPAALLEPGVPRELARHRAATLSDVRYTIDLDVTAEEHADGVVGIGFLRRGGSDLVLDFRGSGLHEVYANGKPVEAMWDRHHIVIPARHLVEGANELRLRFTVPIAAAGAAIIAFDEAGNGERYLYTLLVPSDAQLLFPVFDQPDLKARFVWRITTGGGWRVLSNAPQLDAQQLAEGRIRHIFGETEPISTYTAAFAAGPWSVLDSDPAATAETVIGPRTARPPAIDAAPRGVASGMTLWTRRARAAEVDADTLLRQNRDALEWLEHYFDTPYPFEKLDLLLAPAFPFGGMEHVGAIFYNESNFIFREPPTLPRRLGRASTIYHEVAHQWFGNLVTMRWFDDLWLKEGFSTFMAAKVQQDLHPGSGAWKTFYLRNKPLAYGVDVTSGTTPVWQELANLDLAKSNYGPIVYNKAPAILKQLEFMVGEEAFRRGVQIFVQRHAYDNATWQDLLAAITEASDTNLRRFGEQYILRAGIPVVETQISVDGAGAISALALVQRPARALPGDPGGWWPGRVRVRLGYADRDDVLLDVAFSGTRTVIGEARGLPAPDFVFANDGDFGYGIFLPDSRSGAWLLQHAGSLEDDLLRAMAWGALWDLVREGRIAPDLFATAALSAFRAERDEQIAGLLLGRLAYALERYMATSTDRVRLTAALEDMLLTRVANDTLGYGLRRSALDALLAGARSDRAVAVLREYLNGTRQFDGAPLGQPSRWAAITRLLALGDTQAAALFAAEQARDSTSEADRMAFIAGAAVPTAEAKTSYYDRYLRDESLNEEWVTASLGAFNSPLHTDLTLRFLAAALEAAPWLRDNRRIFFLPRWIDAFIGGHSSPQALHIVDVFLHENQDLPVDVRRRILQARDELELAVRIRAQRRP
ncbi:aminopeptidase N [soil metagenome]